MSDAIAGIIDSLVDLLELETLEIKAGRFSRIAEITERKARLVYQLANSQNGQEISAAIKSKIDILKEATKSNLRTCSENIATLSELIQIHLDVEQEFEKDGTYGATMNRKQIY